MAAVPVEEPVGLPQQPIGPEDATFHAGNQPANVDDRTLGGVIDHVVRFLRAASSEV